MNPLDRIALPDAGMMVTAARELAWNSGADVTVMEGLIRKVTQRAQANMIRRLIVPACNDVEDDSG